MNAITKVFFNLKNRHYFVFDAIVFLLLPIIAFAIRLDGNVDMVKYGTGLIAIMVLFSTVKLFVFYWSGMYKRYWRYASIDELAFIAVVTATAVAAQTLLFILLYRFIPQSFEVIPRSIPLIDGILTFIAVGGLRFSVRLIERTNERRKNGHGERVLIVGAGKAGITLAGEMQRNPQHRLNPVGLIDDDPDKAELRIRGLQVLGNRTDIPQVIQNYKVKRVVIAMPTAPGKDIRDIVNICKQSNVRVSTLPSMFEIIDGQLRVDSLRDVQIEDLLRREPIKTDIAKVAQFVSGKNVLITGAGGSIGSEICRQVIGFNPSEIMLLGHGENTIFDIQNELNKTLSKIRREHPGRPVPKVSSFIADVRSHSRIKILFDTFKPDVIFHAAAHKHVPMMEANPAEAISNNVLGTRNLLFLASRYDVKNFVMISTDKAVNPTSIMGASKRVAEILVLQAAMRTGNRYVCVRFGNVLGSRGSVVPTFKQQIANGGPVTVTHEDIRRYFMTIPEAVQLVLQSSVIGRGGEIFVLDMGEPIRIVDLAKDLIRLSGYEVGRDIKIHYTGLRPGEKLFEELFIPGEEYAPTEHNKVLIACNASQVVPDGLDDMIEELVHASKRDNEILIRATFRKLLPEFELPEFTNGRHPTNGAANGTSRPADRKSLDVQHA
jgi:FlaA1/EpsC-like NDP-sugar epimerase